MRTTFPQLLLNHAAQRPTAAAMREKEYGIWQTTTWADMLALVQHMACGLHQAGLKRHEHMIVVGSNRPRLYATMLAAQSLGAIPVPLYQDAVATECVFPINNADVRFAVVEDQEQVDKMLEIREQCPQLQHVYYDDPRGLRNYDEEGLAALDELVAAGKAFAGCTPSSSWKKCKRHSPMTWRPCFSHRAPPATPKVWCTPTTPCSTAPTWVRVLTNWGRATRCWPTCPRHGSARTFSATPSGWPLAMW